MLREKYDIERYKKKKKERKRENYFSSRLQNIASRKERESNPPRKHYPLISLYGFREYGAAVNREAYARPLLLPALSTDCFAISHNYITQIVTQSHTCASTEDEAYFRFDPASSSKIDFQMGITIGIGRHRVYL